MDRSVGTRVARTMARQHGLITRAQALSAGMTEGQIRWRLEQMAWMLVEPATYRATSAPFTWSTRLLAPVLSTEGLGSHRSAAVLWSVGGVREGEPELSIPRGLTFRRRGVRVHEVRDLHLAGRRVRGGIPITGVARTLIDLGAVTPWTVVEDATMDALDKRLVIWPKILATYARHAKPGRHGCGALRRVIERNVKKAIPGSLLEVRCERALERGGLPMPERQVHITDDDGFVGRVDLAYASRRVVIEVDGRSIHARRAAFESDAIRRSRLAASGWIVIHVTWEQLMGDPAGVVARVSAALALRAAA